MTANPNTSYAESFTTDAWSTTLHTVMQEAVLATTFSNRMMMKPRKLKEMVRHETDAFVEYMQSSSIDPKERGVVLARNGLGHESILAITSSIRKSFRRFFPHVSVESFDMIEWYCNMLVQGYISGREIEVRKEQERAHEAYIRILKKENI